MNRILEHILTKVSKPARYTGGEYNAVDKNKHQVSIRYALCVPNSYEIGMSCLPCRVLYELLNQQPDIWCERCFAPHADMELEMRREGLLLYGLESGDPVADFDMICFYLRDELDYPNIPKMLDLAGLLLHSAQRTELSALVVAGGPCCFNPEPLAAFVDFFILGDWDEVTKEYLSLYQQAKQDGWSKQEFLQDAAQISGIYVPSLYNVSYHPNGAVASVVPSNAAPSIVKKRMASNLNMAVFPERVIVPSLEISHDHIMLDLSRGCDQGCRFCQFGHDGAAAYPHSPERLAQLGESACESSGYQDISLSGLSCSSSTSLDAVCDNLIDYCKDRKIFLSLSCLRPNMVSADLLNRLHPVLRGRFRFAPEAGTQRLRDAIHKKMTRNDLLRACRTIFSVGYGKITLQFMLGLPTETDEDVLAIAQLARDICALPQKECLRRAPKTDILLSIRCFVPKAHSAFQWEGQISMAEYCRRVDLLRNALKQDKLISVSSQAPQAAYLRAVLARGDRRLSAVLEDIWQHGAGIDPSADGFDLQHWTHALDACALDGDFYACRPRERDEAFPWAAISTGADLDFLWCEREYCYQSVSCARLDHVNTQQQGGGNSGSAAAVF